MKDLLDAHQHYWDNTKFDYGWTAAGLPGFERSYLPEDLEPLMTAAGVRRSVAVQVLHSTAETEWLLELAERTPSLAGVVGWVDLQAPRADLASGLQRLASHPKLCGVRHLAHNEPDDEWLLRADVMAGLAIVAESDLAFDLVLRPQHLRLVPALSERLPDLTMVIDHLAKPLIAQRITEPWQRDLRAAAENPRVYGKLSGMITEADHRTWRPQDLAQYVDASLAIFGVERLMYGSDWPVCTLAGSYGAVMLALREVLDTSDERVEMMVFGDNARRIYGLHD